MNLLPEEVKAMTTRRPPSGNRSVLNRFYSQLDVQERALEAHIEYLRSVEVPENFFEETSTVLKEVRV
jgi:hypothetical protein